MRLLNPGPVTLTERVRRALLQPDLCHREPEFADLQARIRSRLLEVYAGSAPEFVPVLLTGSGTTAVEAMVTSIVPHGDTLVVPENGVYGERITQIARLNGIDVAPVVHPWGAPIDVGAVADALETAPGPAHVAVVHHETTTGRLNDLEAIGTLCRARGGRLLVDAVSSFGAERIDFDGWGIDACAASANKCLHAVPGLAFVIARTAVLDDAARPRSLTLHLPAHLRAQEAGGTLFTPAVHACYALGEALAELADEGGWTARHEQYVARARIVRSGLERLGVRRLLSDGPRSCILTAFDLPADVPYEILHDGLKARGFVIYAGQGALSKRIFRVATMGAINSADVDELVAATGEVLDGVRASATGA